MGKDTAYTPKDASKDTGDSISRVRETWHSAKDDAQKSGELIERAITKMSKDKELHDKIDEAYKRSKK